MEDSIVIELVNQQLNDLEKSGKNYVIEGYPRTRVQAVALQKMGVVPDKFFVLDTNEATIYKKLRTSFTTNAADSGAQAKRLSEVELDAAIQNAIMEYNMYLHP